MKNYDLFDDPPKKPYFPYPTTRKTDPITSYEAARDTSFKASAHRVKTLLALFEHGPMTDYELASVTGLQQNSVGKRRKDCQDAGLVTFFYNEDGIKVKRPAPSGSYALVWTLTQDGIDYVENMEMD
jgi:DNA-binding transcriptional ArsR family regulator